MGLSSERARSEHKVHHEALRLDRHLYWSQYGYDSRGSARDRVVLGAQGVDLRWRMAGRAIVRRDLRSGTMTLNAHRSFLLA